MTTVETTKKTKKLSMMLTACATALAFVAGALAVVGCCSISAESQTLDQRMAQAQLSHSGRYEVSGSHGCYGCHGATKTAWPILTSAPRLPAFHFTAENPTSFDDLDISYQDCAVCHIALTGVQVQKTEAAAVTAAPTATAAEQTQNE